MSEKNRREVLKLLSSSAAVSSGGVGISSAQQYNESSRRISSIEKLSDHKTGVVLEKCRQDLLNSDFISRKQPKPNNYQESKQSGHELYTNGKYTFNLEDARVLHYNGENHQKNIVTCPLIRGGTQLDYNSKTNNKISYFYWTDNNGEPMYLYRHDQIGKIASKESQLLSMDRVDTRQKAAEYI